MMEFIQCVYFYLQTLEEAQDYFKRKVEFLSTQIEKVQQVGREKSGIRQGEWSSKQARRITAR